MEFTLHSTNTTSMLPRHSTSTPRKKNQSKFLLSFAAVGCVTVWCYVSFGIEPQQQQQQQQQHPLAVKKNETLRFQLLVFFISILIFLQSILRG
jgi:hypothetical protein